jgi:class 3 adenylate cyclase
VSTVGDAYFGALFPGDGLGADAVDRCARAAVFASSILNFARGLELRVGVHIGDVVGGFVGVAPPKFDLFGAAVEHAKEMEGTGEGGRVHLSHAVLKAAGDGVTPAEWTETALGMLARSWDDTRQEGPFAVPSKGEGGDAVAAVNIEEHAHTIVASLCKLSGNYIDDGEAPQNDDDDDDSEDGEAAALADATERLNYDFSVVFLKFERASVERGFIKAVRRSGLSLATTKFLIIMDFFFFLVHLNLGCFHTAQDRLATTYIAAVLVGLTGYVYWVGTDHRLHYPITTVAFFSTYVASALLLQSDCNAVYDQQFYVGLITMNYLMIAMLAPQFCLTTRLMLRVAVLWGLMVLAYVFFAIRRATIGDEALTWAPIVFVMAVAFTFVSYFADFSLRSSHASTLKLRRLQKKARGKEAAMAAAAMGIMLPGFVTDRIVAAAKQAHRGGSESASTSDGPSGDSRSVMTSTSVVSSNASDDGAASVNFDSSGAVWTYPSVCVMFVDFTVVAADGDGDGDGASGVVRTTIADIEDVVHEHGVLKVKTIGSTMLCLLGIDDALTAEERVCAMVLTARAVQRHVFAPLAQTAVTLRFTVGIHCGPCFGAVIGTDGFIFDIFGDTVNMASRMMSTAAGRTIQLSDGAERALPAGRSSLRFATDKRADVSVKGKGVVTAHVVTDTANYSPPTSPTKEST